MNDELLRQLIAEISSHYAYSIHCITMAMQRIDKNLARGMVPDVSNKRYPNLVSLSQVIAPARLAQFPLLTHCMMVKTDLDRMSQQRWFLLTNVAIGSGTNGQVLLAIEVLHQQRTITLQFSKFYKAKTLNFSDEESLHKDGIAYPPVSDAFDLLYSPEQSTRTVTLYKLPIDDDQWMSGNIRQIWLFDYLKGQPLDRFHEYYYEDYGNKFKDQLKILLNLTHDLMLLNIKHLFFKDIKASNAIFTWEQGKLRIGWIDCEGVRHLITEPLADMNGFTGTHMPPWHDRCRSSLGGRHFEGLTKRSRSFSVGAIDVLHAQQNNIEVKKLLERKFWQNLVAHWSPRLGKIFGESGFGSFLGNIRLFKKLSYCQSEVFSLGMMFLELLVPNALETTGLYGQAMEMIAQDRETQHDDLTPKQLDSFLFELKNLTKRYVTENFSDFAEQSIFYEKRRELAAIIFTMLTCKAEDRANIAEVFYNLSQLYFDLSRPKAKILDEALRVALEDPIGFPADFFEPLKPVPSGFLDIRGFTTPTDSFTTQVARLNAMLY